MKHRHKILQGKINAWRIESLKVFDKITKKKWVTHRAVYDQEVYASDRVEEIQKYIDDYDRSCISILNKKGIEQALLRDSHWVDDFDFVSQMSKMNTFDLIVKPSNNPEEFDLVTRFNNDKDLEFIFGKGGVTKPSPRRGTSPYAARKRQRLATQLEDIESD